MPAQEFTLLFGGFQCGRVLGEGGGGDKKIIRPTPATFNGTTLSV